MTTKPHAERVFRSLERGWFGKPSTKPDAIEAAEAPDADDPRWIKGKPTVLDKQVLTLSPFYPTGRLGICVEKKSSVLAFRYPNHPPFAGVVAWMELEALTWKAI